MDPDAALAEILDIAGRIQDLDRTLEGGDFARLAELVTGLHEWLAAGGFSPQAWALASGSRRRASLGDEGLRYFVTDRDADDLFDFDVVATGGADDLRDLVQGMKPGQELWVGSLMIGRIPE